jgi:hypothetical protein
MIEMETGVGVFFGCRLEADAPSGGVADDVGEFEF